MKYKSSSFVNKELPIRASFSEDCRYIICGSENGHVYIWDANAEQQKAKKFKRKKPEKTDRYEHFKSHDDATTVALFVPRQVVEFSAPAACNIRKIRNLIISSGVDGRIRIFEQRLD